MKTRPLDYHASHAYATCGGDLSLRFTINGQFSGSLNEVFLIDSKLYAKIPYTGCLIIL